VYVDCATPPDARYVKCSRQHHLVSLISVIIALNSNGGAL
jgi:hypothetical protein